MVRKVVAKETQAEVLAACRRRCAICFGLHRDMGIKDGQIAHLDHNAANPLLNNLVFLCLMHHDRFDSKTSQSKGLTTDEVRRYRQELVAAIEKIWRRPIVIDSVEVPPPDGVSGRWVRDNNSDSAEIEIHRLSDNRVRVAGFALHGKTSDSGPKIGELDCEGELIDEAITIVDERRQGHRYVLRLQFLGNRVLADEQGAFGYFGAGAHFGGEYHRPRPDSTSKSTTSPPAPPRVTIRETSAAEILGSLKATPSYRFYEQAEELFLERWTREPGWRATVYDLPGKLSGGGWLCSFKEVGSDTLVFASTDQDVSMLRIGDIVIVSGRIARVTVDGTVSLELATIRADNGSLP